MYWICSTTTCFCWQSATDGSHLSNLLLFIRLPGIWTLTMKRSRSWLRKSMQVGACLWYHVNDWCESEILNSIRWSWCFIHKNDMYTCAFTRFANLSDLLSIGSCLAPWRRGPHDSLGIIGKDLFYKLLFVVHCKIKHVLLAEKTWLFRKWRCCCIHSMFVWTKKKKWNESSAAFSQNAILCRPDLSWRAMSTWNIGWFWQECQLENNWRKKQHKHSFNLHTLLPVVTVRDAKHTNFVEFRNFKIVYRRYEIILDNGNAQWRFKC